MIYRLKMRSRIPVEGLEASEAAIGACTGAGSGAGVDNTGLASMTT